MHSAELVVRIGQIHTRLEESSAQGFRNVTAMKLLVELESAVDALMSVATAEHMAKGGAR
jgi:hypothetical protein